MEATLSYSVLSMAPHKRQTPVRDAASASSWRPSSRPASSPLASSQRLSSAAALAFAGAAFLAAAGCFFAEPASLQPERLRFLRLRRWLRCGYRLCRRHRLGDCNGARYRRCDRSRCGVPPSASCHASPESRRPRPEQQRVRLRATTAFPRPRCGRRWRWRRWRLVRLQEVHDFVVRTELAVHQQQKCLVQNLGVLGKLRGDAQLSHLGKRQLLPHLAPLGHEVLDLLVDCRLPRRHAQEQNVLRRRSTQNLPRS